MARLTARLERLEERADAARFIRQALDLARDQRRHLGELVASAQEHRAWFRWDDARHPPPVYPDGRIDLEPSIRRWAMWAGHDPDLAVRELMAIIERRTAGGPAAEPADAPKAPSLMAPLEPGEHPCPYCAERGETKLIPAYWKHCGACGVRLYRAARGGDEDRTPSRKASPDYSPVG
jgi:hypothetical protein